MDWGCQPSEALKSCWATFRSRLSRALRGTTLEVAPFQCYSALYDSRAYINLPRYPAPSGFTDSAAIPSVSSLRLTAFSVQSKPSAACGKLSEVDSASWLASLLEGEGLSLDVAAILVLSFGFSDDRIVDDNTVSMSTPGNKDLRAVSRSRIRFSAAVRLLRVNGVRDAFRL
jgi:hypothetical protein